ncbi:ergosterol biosynthetic protein 28 homolog isoform X2 [Echinops telfairi]|nr:ergosterol biosynthetic protein 28 homolog isoform X2 [Echinops telfairi]
MGRFLNVLRSWLVMVSIIAMGNTLQSFRDHSFLYEKLYTGKPDLVNGLQARTFGIWTLLSSVIRCLCAIDIHNRTKQECMETRLHGKAGVPVKSIIEDEREARTPDFSPLRSQTSAIKPIPAPRDPPEIGFPRLSASQEQTDSFTPTPRNSWWGLNF